MFQLLWNQEASHDTWFQKTGRNFLRLNQFFYRWMKIFVNRCPNILVFTFKLYPVNGICYHFSSMWSWSCFKVLRNQWLCDKEHTSMFFFWCVLGREMENLLFKCIQPNHYVSAFRCMNDEHGMTLYELINI